jgi:uncharacterized protein YdaU (DUF1376 family)
MTDFYKMDPADWDNGTARLSLEEEAAYLRIVNSIHKHKGPVPDVDRVLAGMFRTSTRKARALVSALQEAGKIAIEDGAIWNDRARSDLVHRGFVSISRAESGAKGGRKSAEVRAKSLAANDTTQAIASTREEKRREEVKEIGKPISRPSVDHEACITHFNAVAERVGWAQVQKISPARKAALSQRLSDCGGAEAWCEAMDRASRSPLLTGQTGRGWRADFDWLCKAANFTKLMEGNYDPQRSGNSGAARSGGMVDAFAAVAAARSGHA